MLGNTSKIIILLLLCFLLGQVMEAYGLQIVKAGEVFSTEKIPKEARINNKGYLVWNEVEGQVAFYRVYGYHTAESSHEVIIFEVSSQMKDENGDIYFDLSETSDGDKKSFIGYEFYRVSAVWKDRSGGEIESGLSDFVRSGGFSDDDGTELYIGLYESEERLLWESDDDALFYKIYYSDEENPTEDDLEVLEVVYNKGVSLNYEIPLVYRILLFSSAYFWVVPVNLSGEGPWGNSVYIEGAFAGD